MKVLVVDDFATMRKVVRNMLRQIGFENVSEAENGEEGFRMAKAGGFGLIVSDWNMPVMNGLEFLKAVRADEKTKKNPISDGNRRGAQGKYHHGHSGRRFELHRQALHARRL